ncbi:MAG: hypothetical protein DWI00_15160 [Planctomycetota bacterium]|nr:MAG: hypothetical protein DWI00_15160 [Planctomycetota bacterium]
MQKPGPVSTLTDAILIVMIYGTKLRYCRNEVPVELLKTTHLRPSWISPHSESLFGTFSLRCCSWQTTQ